MVLKNWSISAHFFSALFQSGSDVCEKMSKMPKKVGFWPKIFSVLASKNPHKHWVFGTSAHFPTFFIKHYKKKIKKYI